MADLKAKRKKKKQKLVEEDEDREEGVANPIMTGEDYASDTGLVYSGGEESAPESVDDLEDAENLAKDMKTKHAQKQKELSQVVSPKDDIAGELRTVKKKSKQKIEETIRLEEESEREDTARTEIPTEVAEDGTLPMPEGEETGEVVTTSRETEGEDDESEVKKLKRKKEKTEESEITALTPEDTKEEVTVPEKTEEKKDEPETKPEEATAKAPRKSRLKDRLAKAKEEAKSEVQKEQREERREKRLKREQQITRFDTEYDEAEYEKMQEEKSNQLKRRWKKMGQPTADRGVYIPTQEEAYDFFTRIWEPEEVVEKSETETEEKKEEDEAGPSDEKKDEEKEEEDEDKDKEEGDEEGKEEDETEEGKKDKKKDKKKKEKDEDKVPLLDEMDQFADEEGYGLVAVRKADYPDPVEQEKKEAEILYVPSITRVPAEQKVSEEVQPRFLEDEGFYVGVRPEEVGWNLNMMEHRLLKEPDGRRWFGEDGRMKSLPDPLRITPSRPPVSEEPEPYLETVYKGAIIREFDNKYIDGSVDNTGFYQLDVDINAIAFSHHHLFSQEHVMSARLNDLYKQFLNRKMKNMTEYLTEKLKALKSSALHLREHMLTHKAEHSYADRSNYERRLRDYKYEIRKARDLRDSEEQADRQLLKGIIHTWKEIKALRELNKYNNTPLKLQIKKEEVDKSRDQMIWRQEIEEELDEKRDAHEEEFQKKMAEYQEQKKLVEAQKKAKADAAKRLKKRGSKASRSSKTSKASQRSADPDPTPEQIQADNDILNEEDLVELEQPIPFDEAATREMIKQKAMEIRRRPGEPKLIPELTNTASITPSSQCPRGEQQRRDMVSKCKVFVKVLFNNKEVSRTDQRPLQQDFKINFGQIFNSKIVQWPESIKYQIYETQGFGQELLAELYAGIPEVSITSQAVQLENVSFSCDHRVKHNNEAVGSGVPFHYRTKTDKDMVTLMTTGELGCSVAWAVDENGQPLVPPLSSSNKDNLFSAMKKLDPLSAISPSGAVDIEKLSKWFEESRLDPNDPSNADLVYMLKPKGGDMSHLKPPEYFRLEQLQEEFDMATEEEIDSNKRFQLLRLRDEEVQEFRNYKMVPLNVREIPRDTFTDYERKKREEENLKYAASDDMEHQKAGATRYMQKIREQVIQRFRLLAHLKRLEDVVLEEAVPNIAMLGTSLLQVTERRRPMRPTRKERKKVTAQAIKGDEVKILVNVTRALYVPIRTSSSTSGGGATTARDTTQQPAKTIMGDTLVRPYVEVMFQNNFMRTVVGDGPNPSFNEELQIPFKAPNEDYSANNLQTIGDVLYLNLFDEVVIDIQEDDRNRGTTLHQRIEKKWLGSLSIPFTTVYFNGKIDGTFCVKSPPILLGYTHEHGSSGGELEMNVSKKEENTYLTLFITIEPPLVPAEPMKERFSSNEDEKLLQYAELWQKELTDKFNKREYKTTVINISGQSVFVTRYFKPLKPPAELTASAKGRVDELLARFVSMIPFVSDSVVFPGLCDIWSTCNEFLQMMAGDEEEHAVLLTNYFLSIGKKAWLVIGTGIPEGATAYVLTEEDGNYSIWNAATGLHYSYHDYFCPLQSVGCLMNNENIYGNIQKYDKPSQMNFDVSNTADWKPFFNRSFPRPDMGSNQPEALHYFPTDQNYVIELQEKIEQMLKNKIMEWRARFLTRWNRHCTQMMRRILPMLEENLGKPPASTQLSELEQTFASYKVSGFPINLPFTDLNSISETVFATGVHAHDTSDVEFALAVYIHPYPNTVLSMWIYVASLVRVR